MTGILIDEQTLEPIVSQGTLALGDTTLQTAHLAVTAMRGEFKESPAIGGEAARQLGGTPDPFWPGRVKKMLRHLGVEATTVSLDEGTLTITMKSEE